MSALKRARAREHYFCLVWLARWPAGGCMVVVVVVVVVVAAAAVVVAAWSRAHKCCAFARVCVVCFLLRSYFFTRLARCSHEHMRTRALRASSRLFRRGYSFTCDATMAVAAVSNATDENDDASRWNIRARARSFFLARRKILLVSSVQRTFEFASGRFLALRRSRS